MAEYFANPQDAEAYIRRASRPTVLYARIQLHGAEKWMVDHDRRALGSSIKILEDLTGTVNRIKSSEATMSAKATPLEDLRSCPSCGKSDSPYDAGSGLNLFRCSCGKVYCDACSGGGLITLPRCPVSPYHEDLQKVGTLPTAAKPMEAASPTGATTPRPVSSSSPEPPTSPLPKDATIRTIMVFKSGAEALNEIVYLHAIDRLRDDAVLKHRLGKIDHIIDDDPGVAGRSRELADARCEIRLAEERAVEGLRGAGGDVANQLHHGAAFVGVSGTGLL